MKAKEEELREIGRQRDEVHIAMKRGELSKTNGDTRLAEIEALNEAVKQDPVYEKWKQVYDEAAARAATKERE